MTCPSGTVGQPYSLPLYILPADGKRGEDYSCATFRVTSGTFPPGLTFANDAIQGTPTQAGTFESYITVDYPGCGKPASDQRLIISINLGVPKLTLGPESAATGTTGAPYSLQMTASVADAKTFSISTGALPPGLALDASSGLISGTPTTAGTYDFTVYAKVNADSRSDTKALEIVVRTPLTISAADPFSSARRAQGEVGIPFDATLEAAGGLGPYTWTLASGTLPSGLTLAAGRSPARREARGRSPSSPGPPTPRAASPTTRRVSSSPRTSRSKRPSFALRRWESSTAPGSRPRAESRPAPGTSPPDRFSAAPLRSRDRCALRHPQEGGSLQPHLRGHRLARRRRPKDASPERHRRSRAQAQIVHADIATTAVVRRNHSIQGVTKALRGATV